MAGGMKRHRVAGLATRSAVLVVCALWLALAAPGASAITPTQLANQALRIDPRKPSDINLFTSRHSNGAQGFYPAGSAMTPASGPVLTEAQVRNRLRAYLIEEFDNDTARVNAALAQFDAANTKNKIPEPLPRAAVVGMRATLLWPSISFGLAGNRFVLVRTGTLPNSSFVAGSSGGSTNRVVTVNSRYRSEDFRYLVGIMGHEFLHHDGSNLTSEEAILNSLSAMTYVQVLIEHPELAYTRTELSRQMNDLALIFLNSRENDSPNSEVYAPTGVGVAPGSPRNEPDIWSIFNGSGTSPAPAPFGQILSNLGLPAATNFGLGTAQTFASLNDAWVSDVGRAQISVLLKMRSVAEISNRSGLSRNEVINKLRLQPYLNAMN